MIGRDEEGKLAGGLESAGGVWRQFVMRFPIHIIKFAINLKLIVADLIVERRITTPAFLFREGSLERVKVKAGQLAAERSDSGFVVEKELGYRSATVGTGRRTCKYTYARVWRYLTRHTFRSYNCARHRVTMDIKYRMFRYIRAYLKIERPAG